MNWYRFKIELFGVVWKTFMCVFMVISYRQTLLTMGDYSLMVPAEYGILAYPWVMPASMWGMLAFLWLLYFAAFRVLRADARYGER